MNKLRISVVQYLNTAPLVRGFTHGPLRGKYDLSFTVPSQCAEALRNNEADVAIIPAIEYQRIPGLVILPDLAIASKHRVRSLLIISKRQIHGAKRIALDRSSRSTQSLTRILCDQLWKISPEFFEAAPDLNAMLRDADAAMLIGDPALRFALDAQRTATLGPDGSQVCTGTDVELPAFRELHVYDVVEQWRLLTGLPAVLAVWAARPSVVTPELVEEFLASRDFGLAQIEEIGREASAELNLPADALARYLRENIDFALDKQNLEGLTTFYAQAARLGLTPRQHTVSIAAEPASRHKYIDMFLGRSAR